ncbi:MAG: hypothetical protein HQK54_15080 [Oligoflexales bacterium]|nr:hypothetical protein [Oligoflexales bacterium]
MNHPSFVVKTSCRTSKVIFPKLFHFILAIILFSFFAESYGQTGNHPFPSQINYPHGIKPTHVSQEQMNIDAMNWFKLWSSKYVTAEGCDKGHYRVQRVETGDNNDRDTVSEGIGYGMLIMVYMFNEENNTKPYFDGFWRYYRKFMNRSGLMNWRISKHGQVLGSGGATDADVDAAYALLMADAQWGSSLEINYAGEAKKLIQNILKYEINSNNDVRPGDGWDRANPSYFSPAYFRVFGDFTHEPRWYQVASHTYNSIVNYYYNSNETKDASFPGEYTGLLPNWCGYEGGSSGWGDMDPHGYWWDAVRFPWRQGYDYLLFGEKNSALAKANTARISAFFKRKYGGDPSKIASHYNLKGQLTPYCRNDRKPDLCDEDVMNLACGVGSTAVAAMVEGDQEWLNSLYKRLVDLPMTETNVNWGTDYFCDTLKMLYLLVLSGNMMNPLD